MTFFVNMIELISLLGIGLMAGASLYISWVEVPARQDLATLDKLVNWESNFPKAMAVLKKSGMVILPFFTADYALSFSHRLAFCLCPFDGSWSFYCEINCANK